MGLGRFACGAVVALLVAFGCGSQRPRATDNSTVAPGTTGGTATFGGDGGSTLPPGCGKEPDGTTCDCLDTALFVDPPTIYFVLDRSGSMQAFDKWNQTRVVVGDIMRSLGPRANFGATYFPALNQQQCSVGQEVMSVRPGDPPSSTADGPTTTFMLAVTRVPALGGTPTGPTLELVRANLARAGGKKFVILATDGAPNCNPSAGCGIDQCQPNIEDIPDCPAKGPTNCCELPAGTGLDCNDISGTVTAIAALKAEGVPTYVVGLPGAANYAAILDQMAIAGGTANAGSPKYFAVDDASETVMLAALKRVAAQITGTCEFALKSTPDNASLVNVYLDDIVLPFEPKNGWTIDGDKVTLVGDACTEVKSGDVLNVRIITGCPRVEPH